MRQWCLRILLLFVCICCSGCTQNNDTSHTSYPGAIQHHKDFSAYTWSVCKQTLHIHDSGGADCLHVGEAVGIYSGGYIITAKHILADTKRNFSLIHTTGLHTLTNIRHHPTYDLAIARIRTLSGSISRITPPQVDTGASLWVNETTVLLTKKNTPYGGIDIVSTPGMSGSPVSVRNKLVGILTSYVPSSATSTALFFDEPAITLWIKQHLDAPQ